MHTVYLDPAFDGRGHLDELYDGQIIVRSPSPASTAFVGHARRMIGEAFPGIDPLQAQHQMEVEEFVERFAPLKSGFIHHPDSLDHICAILHELGWDPDDTYVDGPRLRVATSHGYLTSGVAYAHHPHRDTWYSAPLAQINWWMPIFDYATGAGMAFHPRYWSQGVRNGSSSFDYYRWNAEGRAQAKQHVRSDTRVQPKAEEPLELEPELRVISRAGGLVMFSAAQLHSTSRNLSGVSRWSVDFRTVNIADVVAGRGAPNVDSHPTGTSLRDFVRLRDRAPMPEEVARLFDNRDQVEGQLVYSVPASGGV
jgi:hypothetical protein